MPVEVVDAHIEVDLECTDCSYQWQEDYYEEHVANAVDRDFECPRCEVDNDRGNERTV